MNAHETWDEFLDRMINLVVAMRAKSPNDPVTEAATQLLELAQNGRIEEMVSDWEKHDQQWRSEGLENPIPKPPPIR